ncbi:helix-turn-helix transcriptional regulator [Variovorax sp. ZT4R33]|uniref:helix-turn-helix transcriptional regulator n=1 Tax=Variovorax sp. ZT4R33 TaxID=3443743 RepID=UPI003F469077
MTDRIDAIYALWDRLADFSMGESDAALIHLLDALCQILGAQNALWCASLRLAVPAAGDRLDGWRPRLVRLLHAVPAVAASVQQRFDQLGSANVDASLLQAVTGDAPFRVQRLVDAVAPAWFDGEHYRRHYLGIGFADSMSVRWALNADVRIHCILFRDAATPRFDAADKEPFALAVRGLKWFLRRQLLGHGLLMASTPLTSAERDLLPALIEDRTEKQIAQDLGQSSHDIHVQVKSIYGKYGVTKRSALSALWQGNLR